MTNATVQPHRPVSVWIVSVIMGVNGAGALIAAMAAVGAGVPRGVLALNALFGLVLLGVAVGVYALRLWAWSATIVLQIVTLVSAVLAWASDSSLWVATVVDVVVSLLIILLMVRPGVRTLFRASLVPTQRPPQ